MSLRKVLSCLLHVLLCLPSVSISAPGQGGHEEFYQLVQVVLDIAGGKTSESAIPFIGSGARLVLGGRDEDLKAAVSGEIKGLSLGDSAYHGVSIQARTNSSEDMGFIVLKTRKSDPTQVRVHTVVIMKDSLGQYRISLWHAGGGIEGAGWTRD